MRSRLGTAAHGVSGPARSALALLAAGQPDAAGSTVTDLADADADAAKATPELADAGLLDRSHGQGIGSGTSYTMHPLVRAFAGELLS